MGIGTQSLRAVTMRGRPQPSRGPRLRDRFELLVPLGVGGFATVWEGFDMLLERPVAVKELPIDGVLSGAGDALREARATARLNHPTIVSLYEIVAEDDRIYMINELVHGSTLGELLDEGLLSDHDTGKIGYGLCEALAHAHSHGVVHRDVKPANVMVTDEWINGVSGWRAQPAKLMDFGIASILDSGPGAHGPHAGSRGYVAPEQEAGEVATPASDVYSLALVLFECFTGVHGGRGRQSRLTRARSDLPVELTECLDRCLEPDPSMRPGVDDLATQLSLALPELSEDLPDVGMFSRLTRTMRLRRSHTDRGAQLQIDAARLGIRVRLACGAVAVTICVLTMLAAQLAIAPLAAVAAGALLFALPRVGWPLAFAGGAVALAVLGQDGSALMLAAPALLAALPWLLPLPKVLDGALWGALAFLWIAALQAISSTAIVISMPAGLPDAASARGSIDDAARMMSDLAIPAYGASLGLWAVAGMLAVWLARRGSSLVPWSMLVAAAIAAQVLTGESLAMPVPLLTAVAGSIFAVACLLAAASTRRIGRVFDVRGTSSQHLQA